MKLSSQKRLQMFIGLTLLLVVLFIAPLDLRSQQTEPAAHQPITRDSRYPAHWWTPISKEGAPAWEIMPQEAGAGEVILSKRNELGLLSNFAATPFTFAGQHYASLEGFWQMTKYPEGPDDSRAKFPGLEWKYTREQVGQLTSFEAKNAGTLADANMKKMGITWVTFAGKQFEYRPQLPGEHYRLIVAATRAKVSQNPEVSKVLLSTGDLILKPDHHQEPNAPAAWRYYEILTKIRSELQNEKLPALTFGDLQKNDGVEGPFRIVGYVIDFFKCQPCPPRAMCKPCVGDHIVVVEALEEKDPARVKGLWIFADKPDKFELRKKYSFTVKPRGKIAKGQPIRNLDLIAPPVDLKVE
jgi:predicted NAD-dependent protein-ADP-ribosyltransferase YbiA (DUF1768 family)